MTSEGWCTVFSAGLHSLGGLSGTPFSLGNPQNRQKVPKIGGTPFGALFQEVPPFSGVKVAVGPKKCGKLPQRVIRRGRLPHFLGPPDTTT